MTDPAAHARAQCCYTTAYFVLPNYAFTAPDRLFEAFGRDPVYAARFYNVMACKSEGRDPDHDEVAAVTGHSGALDGALRYHAVQFPKFPPADLSKLSLDPAELDQAAKRFVLAPYFSAVVYSDGGGIAHYFVLGQSPAAGTTLREVTRQTNANLGPGCEPELEAFLSLLRDRLRGGPEALEPVAGVLLNRPARQAPPKQWWQFWK
jgi:hypothetical protein